mgnify:CR=1 FL=1
MKKLLIKLIDKYGYSHETERTLTKIKDLALTLLLALILCIDWDMTLTNLGF